MRRWMKKGRDGAGAFLQWRDGCSARYSPPNSFYDAVKSCRPVELTFHEPVSREIRDGLAGTSQRTAVVPSKAPGAARVSFSAVAGRVFGAVLPSSLLFPEDTS